jgi:hypothetical protein
MKINAGTLSSLRQDAEARIGRARRKLDSLQGRASRALRGFRLQARRRGAHWTERVRQLTSSVRALRLNKLQAQLMDAVGVASSGQVERISRELAKISKKLDAISGTKPN